MADLANLRNPTSRPTSQPTILHNPTTDDYSAQDLSSGDDASFDAPNNNNDDEWSEPNDPRNDHDLLIEANVEFEDDESSDTCQSNNPTQDNHQTIYKCTSENDWRKVGGLVFAREIEPVLPVPYVQENTLFSPNISPEDVESLKDASGDIRFEKVFDWCLPRSEVWRTDLF